MAYNYLEELYFQTIWNHSVEDAAKKSAEITKNIAIKFAEWITENAFQCDRYACESITWETEDHNKYSTSELLAKFKEK
jgi:hypothetical protein